MPPAIIAAAIVLGASAAAAAGYIAISTALIIAITATVAGAMMTKSPGVGIGAYASQQERKQVLRSSVAPQLTIYGTSVTSGLLFFAEEEAGTTEKEWLHLAIAICGHPIDHVSDIWLGDDLIGVYGDLVTWEIHNNRTTPDPFMLANCASWKSDMIGVGITWARISLKFDAEKFPSGLPNITFKVYGKKILDPRSGSTVWSNNASLCILDYYRSTLQVPDSNLNMDQFIQGANICDQSVVDGSTGRTRYTINGMFDANETRSAVLDDLHRACAGEPTYMAGLHGILVGAYYGPATMTLTQDQIISDVKIVAEASYAEKLNVVTGTFVDAQQKYTEVDYPAVRVQSYIDADGSEFSDDLKLRFVDNEFQAQALAQIKINRTRIGRSLSFTMNLSGYKYRPGYYVFLTLPPFGITNQEFRITEWGLSIDGGVEVTLKQETASVWLDAIGQPIERPDITDFPKAEVGQPTNLVYTPTAIGEVVQGVLSWTNVGQIQYNIVTIRLAGAPVLTMSVPGESCVLNGLVRNSYTASVRAVNFMGQQSAEAFLIFNINAPPPPSSVDVAMGYFQYTLTPRLAELVNTSTQFDFWFAGETALANTNDATVLAGATRVGMGQQFTKSDLQADHTYYWYIRTINAYGTSAFIQKAAQYVYETAGLIDMIDAEIKGSETFKQLVTSTDDLYQAAMENALTHEGNIQRQYKYVNALDVKLSASITEISTIVADNKRAYAEKFTQVQATIEGQGNRIDAQGNQISITQATVTQVSSAYVDLNNKLSAQWGAKVQIDSNGNKYIAGIQLGVEGNGGPVQSYFLMSADTVAIYNPSNASQKLAFAVKGGQVFLSEGIFDYASITLAKLGSWYSANYVSGSTGTIMRADGSFELNGSVAGQGRVQITGDGISVYDGSGNLKVRVGRLS